MPVKIRLRSDYNAEELRRLASRLGGMDRQILCDWVHRFNAEGPEGLTNRKVTWVRSKLTRAQELEVARLVDEGPDMAKDGVVRWRRVDLQKIIKERFDVTLCLQSVSNILARQGYSFISARPRHPGQDPRAIATFKKLP